MGIKVNIKHQRLTVALLLLLFVSPFSQAAASTDKSLIGLINERLGHMKTVAAHKWINQLPIEDLAREEVVIERAQRSGLEHGITMASSDQFFSAQIIAAKEIQTHWFEQWESGDAPSSAPDLVKEVRPELLILGEKITAQLTDRDPNMTGEIQAEGLSAETANALRRAINHIKQYPNTLEQVLDSKILRVGTTWDYKPFSHKIVERPMGIDIDLAQDLAASLGASVEFVTTAWPTLMDDFNANRFDIGMSGISINLSRQRDAYFSSPYHTGGKTPITRCNDVDRVNSLEKINTEGQRVIVNPGGTNERFARANINPANLSLHNDNRTIFTEIIENRADVMMTDAIEVGVQANLHPELCAAMPGETFTFQQKGYLLPQDEVWKRYVDTWLNQRIGDGTFTDTFSTHNAEFTGAN
jgi:cyclohexadienyl dehydratase